MQTANRFLNTAQQYAPLVQQIAPMFQNLPAMWRLYKGFQSLPTQGAGGVAAGAKQRQQLPVHHRRARQVHNPAFPIQGSSNRPIYNFETGA